MTHALLTEREEVMGLLLGDTTEDSNVDIWASMTLQRSDKQPDRVEISPEQLSEALEFADKLSQDIGKQTRVVGWYHSHPHITVLPSHVDLRTQLQYQTMDKDFIGLIFTAFNTDARAGALRHELMAFRARSGGVCGSTSELQRVVLQADVVPACELLSEEEERRVAASDAHGVVLGHQAGISAVEHTICEMRERYQEDIARLQDPQHALKRFQVGLQYCSKLGDVMGSEILPMYQYFDDVAHNAKVLAEMTQRNKEWHESVDWKSSKETVKQHERSKADEKPQQDNHGAEDRHDVDSQSHEAQEENQAEDDDMQPLSKLPSQRVVTVDEEDIRGRRQSGAAQGTQPPTGGDRLLDQLQTRNRERELAASGAPLQQQPGEKLSLPRSRPQTRTATRENNAFVNDAIRAAKAAATTVVSAASSAASSVVNSTGRSTQQSAAKREPAADTIEVDREGTDGASSSAAAPRKAAGAERSTRTSVASSSAASGDAEDLQMYSTSDKCIALTLEGRSQCSNHPVKGSGFCGVHLRSLQAKGKLITIHDLGENGQATMDKYARPVQENGDDETVDWAGPSGKEDVLYEFEKASGRLLVTIFNGCGWSREPVQQELLLKDFGGSEAVLRDVAEEWLQATSKKEADEVLERRKADAAEHPVQRLKRAAAAASATESAGTPAKRGRIEPLRLT
eukprot:TRINITY_DN17845_c0_g1_i1.p1 TRINITY_DN17845_c0_g1~~TRINITY_DN17845_c0_g1_i1.p1  ORF type:complete len:722 (+),score=169.33 TRINITY_DN17845_c0_g1_i1:119-2167(+)